MSDPAAAAQRAPQDQDLLPKTFDPKAVETRIAEVERHLNEVKAEIDGATTPQTLKEQNATLKLGLVSPRETQVIYPAEQPEIRLASKRRQEIYADASVTPVVFRRDFVR